MNDHDGVEEGPFEGRSRLSYVSYAASEKRDSEKNLCELHLSLSLSHCFLI